MRVLAAALVALVPALVSASEPQRFGLEVRFRPGGGTGTYVCEAEVKNIPSGEVVSAPRITFKSGTSATAQTSSGDLLSVLSVSIDSTAGVGTAELTVSRAAKVVAAQKTPLRLR